MMQILESKRAYRAKLAALPFAEKIVLLKVSGKDAQDSGCEAALSERDLTELRIESINRCKFGNIRLGNTSSSLEF